MKTCNKCGVPKECTEFHKRAASKDGVTSRCKKCRCAYQNKANTKNREKRLVQMREYRNENLESLTAYMKTYSRENRENIAEYKRGRYYGLPPGDFKRMLANQGGVCAICKGPGGKKGLCVDHDHESGKVRALLCLKCNTAIGFLNDSSALAQVATNYLKKHGK